MLTIEKLIEQDYGIEYSSERWGRSTEHSSLVIDKEKKLYFWNSKGLAGDALHYLMNIRKMPFEDAKEYLKSQNYTDTYVYTIRPDHEEDIIVYPKLADSFYDYGKDHREYWYTRKFTDQTIDLFRLGWYDDWYTIPISMDGVFRQIQKRRDLPKKEVSKWYKSVPALLFNSDVLRITDTIFIVEGPNDVISLTQQGFPSTCSDSGSETWLEDWFSKFAHCKTIYLCFDNDRAGQIGSMKVAKELGIYRSKIYNFDGFDKGYSPAYFFRDGGTKEQFLDLLKGAKYSFELGVKGYGRRNIRHDRRSNG